jgi:hypothetical protein
LLDKDIYYMSLKGQSPEKVDEVRPYRAYTVESEQVLFLKIFCP